MKNKLKIAITGGIGSGKTLVAKFIEEMGYKVIQADDISKNILFNDKVIQSKIIDTFGQESVVDGNVNKQFLIDSVFCNEKNVKKINAILHPPVINEINKLMNEILIKDDFVFVEAALIFEANMQNMFDLIFLVTSDLNTRIIRIKDRDGKDEDDIMKIVDKQLPDEEKIALSDFHIQNNNSIEWLKENVQTLLGNLNKFNI